MGGPYGEILSERTRMIYGRKYGKIFHKLKNFWVPFLKSSRSVQVFKRILKNKLLDNFVNIP